MGLIAKPYADAEGQLITGGPFDHLWHMITYAAQLTSPHGPQGIASYPWQWLLDLKPITYLRINPSLPGQGLYAIHPGVGVLRDDQPADPGAGDPGAVFGVYRFVRGGRWCSRRPARPATRRRRPCARSATCSWRSSASAWFIGTWVPYELQSALDSRTSYLYYMVIVMPGLYVAVAYLISLGWRRGAGGSGCGRLIAVWGVTVIVAVVLMYPFVAAF